MRLWLVHDVLKGSTQVQVVVEQHLPYAHGRLCLSQTSKSNDQQCSFIFLCATLTPGENPQDAVVLQSWVKPAMTWLRSFLTANL